MRTARDQRERHCPSTRLLSMSPVRPVGAAVGHGHGYVADGLVRVPTPAGEPRLSRHLRDALAPKLP